MPDMAEYTQASRTWIHNYVLNSTFGGAPYDEPYNQLALTYMRRTESAFQEYYAARNALASYISSPREHVSKYFESLHHFELLISLTYQAYMLMRHFLANDQVYVRGDKSELDRIDTMYNFIKHADEKLNKMQFPKKYSSHVWLTNSGVSCKKATVLFSELADALKDMANGAKRFGNPTAVLQEPQPITTALPTNDQHQEQQ